MTRGNQQINSVLGLTIREQFAAMCLQGMLSNHHLYEATSVSVEPNELADFYSLCAVEQADSLIKALNDTANKQ